MGLFGWSLPPGCSSIPEDEDMPCAVCGLLEMACICPECPVCGEMGNPNCYKEHGLVRTQEQIDSLLEQEKIWAEECRQEAEYWANYDPNSEEQV